MSTYTDQLQPYQNFENETMLKKAFNLFRKVFRYELTESDNKVLFEMTGYAVKFPGACKMKLETIAKITGVSLATVKRAIAKAIKLGILKRYKTRKDNGRRQGTTVYQFQQFNGELQDEPQTMSHRQQDAIPSESKGETAKSETEALNSLSPSLFLKDTNITIKHADIQSVDKEAIKKNALLGKLPNALHGLSLFFDKSHEIYDMTGVIFAAKNKVSKEIRIEEHEGLFRKTIASVYEYWKRQVKSGKNDYNVFGLMSKAIKELVEKIINGSAYEIKKVSPVVSTGRTELVPDWFHTRNESKVEEMGIDFAAERERILKKLQK